MQVCRLCLADNKNDAKIFKVHETRIRIEIMACTSLEMDEDDDLPKTICTDCRLRLEEYYQFRRRCQAADRRLRLKNKRKRQDADLNEEDETELNTEKGRGGAERNDNIQWRFKAAHIIRAEMETYKKKLHNLCKQQVRRDIEEQVRAEVEELVLAEAKKQSRLIVLDELFCEMERFFIRKRNEADYEHVSGSEGYDGSEIESAATSTQIDLDTSTKRLETDAAENDVPLEETGEFVELDDSSSDQDGIMAVIKTEPAPNQPTVAADPPAISPMAMVEINMQDTELNHLREDLSISSFLKSGPTPSPIKPKRVQFPAIPDQGAAKSSGIKIRETLCRKHSFKSKQHYAFSEEALRNCVRCRLRGSDKINEVLH